MGLVIVIEPHGTYAIYEQIVNQIKNQIISGELQPDEALPSLRGLAADMELVKRLQEWITLAKQAGLGTEDIREMLEGLL